MPKTVSSDSSFKNGLYTAVGSALGGALASHAHKYHSPTDLCGYKILLAKVGLAYYATKKYYFGAGPKHVAAEARLKNRVEIANRNI